MNAGARRAIRALTNVTVIVDRLSPPQQADTLQATDRIKSMRADANPLRTLGLLSRELRIALLRERLSAPLAIMASAPKRSNALKDRSS